MNTQEIPPVNAGEAVIAEPDAPTVEVAAQKGANAEKAASNPSNTQDANEIVESAAPSGIDAPAEPPTLYCICRSQDETAMIQCDKCNEWFHFRCMNIITQVSKRRPICTWCTIDF